MAADGIALGKEIAELREAPALRLAPGIAIGITHNIAGVIGHRRSGSTIARRLARAHVEKMPVIC